MAKTLAILLVISGISYLYMHSLSNSDREHVAEGSRNQFDYNFHLQDLSGNIVPFSDYKGKVVFLNLWATWCGPCRHEMPGIQKLYESTNSSDVAFVMLSLDKESDQKKVASYVQGNKYSFPVFMASGTLTAQLNVPSIPTTFIIGKDGRIVEHKVGSANYNTDKYRKLLTDLAR